MATCLTCGEIVAVLAGTKYTVRQNRGRFGLGAKMALLWAKMSTGEPLRVRSARRKNGPISECVLDIDVHRNVPHVVRHEQLGNEAGWQGTEISVVIQGAWTTYKAKILSYMRQLAVITPYARFELRFTATDASRNVAVLYARRAEHMPAPPIEVKHHPASVDLIVLKRLIQCVLHPWTQRNPVLSMPTSLPFRREAATRKWMIKHALRQQFAGIDAKRADTICNALHVDPGTPTAGLSEAHIKHLRDIFSTTTFPPADGACLSPAGEYNLRLGVMKELRPDMVATWQEPYVPVRLLLVINTHTDSYRLL